MAGSTTGEFVTPGTRTSTPSAPGKVAQTTVLPAARRRTQTGSAVGDVLGVAVAPVSV